HLFRGSGCASNIPGRLWGGECRPWLRNRSLLPGASMSSRNSRFRIVGLVVCSALALLFSSNSFAQADATLRGRVSDPDGAVIPAAQVTLRNPSIGYERTTLTDR